MLLNKKSLSVLCVVFFSMLFCWADYSSNALVERYLVKANDAYDNGQLVEAYRQINLCLKISGEDIDPSVLMIARTIYTQFQLAVIIALFIGFCAFAVNTHNAIQEGIETIQAIETYSIGGQK